MTLDQKTGFHFSKVSKVILEQRIWNNETVVSSVLFKRLTRLILWLEIVFMTMIKCVRFKKTVHSPNDWKPSSNDTLKSPSQKRETKKECAILGSNLNQPFLTLRPKISYLVPAKPLENETPRERESEEKLKSFLRSRFDTPSPRVEWGGIYGVE